MGTLPGCRRRGTAIVSALALGAFVACARRSEVTDWERRGPLRHGRPVPVSVYRGMCDASAAVALPGGRVIVADDEDNKLRVYRRRGGRPLQTFDLSPALALTKGSAEADLEAGLAYQGRIYWLSSHGRSSKGKSRPNRLRLVATAIEAPATPRARLRRIGRPYSGLLHDLTQAPGLAAFSLAKAARRSPKAAGGLNIEGVAAGPAGELLIGFRNPIPEGRALVVPLLNPDGVITGEAARLGPPILLDLGGLGIRDMAPGGADGSGLILVAGSYGETRQARIFRWPALGEPPVAVPDLTFRDFNPEAFVAYPAEGGGLLLSDDGSQLVAGVACKDLARSSEKRFRGVWIDLPEPD